MLSNSSLETLFTKARSQNGCLVKYCDIYELNLNSEKGFFSNQFTF